MIPGHGGTCLNSSIWDTEGFEVPGQTAQSKLKATLSYISRPCLKTKKKKKKEGRKEKY
jgi:hypothetical protein